jgi:hypothetical protein
VAGIRRQEGGCRGIKIKVESLKLKAKKRKELLGFLSIPNSPTSQLPNPSTSFFTLFFEFVCDFEFRASGLGFNDPMTRAQRANDKPSLLPNGKLSQ